MEKVELKYPDLKIEPKDIKIPEVSSGEGAFGVVVKTSRPIYNRNPRLSGHPIERVPIAIKYYSKDDDEYRDVEWMYTSEIDLLSTLKHTNIVSLMGYFEHKKRIALVYHYAPNKSHDCYIGANNYNSRFTWAQCLKISIGVARGLEYLHRGGGVEKIKTTVHRDIKSANILLDKNWGPIIGDFGLSVFASQDEELSELNLPVAGTNGYKDPNYVKSQDLTEKVDLYSFGVFLYEVLSGKIAVVNNPPSNYYDYNITSAPQYVSLLPFLRTRTNELLVKHDALGRKQDYNNLLTLTKIAEKCLQDDTSKRPTMIQLLKELEELVKDQITISNLRVPFLEIEKATENFDDSNMIKWGESGRLYKGKIVTADGSKTVAIKHLNGGFKQEEEVSFFIEILTLSDYKHPNIIHLHGFHCDENAKIVIYEYASNGSLDKYLSSTSKKPRLTWIQILKICNGAALGLEFIHTFKPGNGIVHGDIKASNILITGNWDGMISNFGLTKKNHKNRCKFLTSSTAGTLGYCDPEYMQTGLLTKESDVYSFGLVLFEVLGMKMVVENDRYYGDQVDERKNRADKKSASKKEQIDSKSLSIFLAIARRCVKEMPEERPKMGRVAEELANALDYAERGDSKH